MSTFVSHLFETDFDIRFTKKTHQNKPNECPHPFHILLKRISIFVLITKWNIQINGNKQRFQQTINKIIKAILTWNVQDNEESFKKFEPLMDDLEQWVWSSWRKEDHCYDFRERKHGPLPLQIALSNDREGKLDHWREHRITRTKEGEETKRRKEKKQNGCEELGVQRCSKYQPQ